MQPPDDESNKHNGLQSLARGLNTILAFDRDHPILTISQAAERTGLDRATVRRALLTLTQMGFAKSSGKGFRLTPKVMQLATPFLSSHQFVDLAQPALKDFVEEQGATASICVLDGPDIVYVARVEARRLIRFDIGIGSRLPAHLTALGRVLLAALPERELKDWLTAAVFNRATPRSINTRGALKNELRIVRERGYALIEGELEGGILAIAVPIFNDKGVVIAAVGISSHVGEIERKDILLRYLEPLRAVSAEISAGMLSQLPIL